jgi:hypothetical protein
MAAVTMSGLLTLDTYYFTIDEEPAGAGNDRSTTQFAVYAPVNYLRARYVNDAATFGGQFTVFTGRFNDDSRDENQAGYFSGVYDVGGGSNYIWWKPMPALELRFGIIPQIVGGKVGPPTHLKGHDIIVMITYGNLHTSGRQGVGAYYKFNEMVSLEVGLYDPDDDSTPAIAGLGAGEENVIPRLDLAVPIRTKFAGTSSLFNFKGSILPKSYKDVATGDDSFTVTTIGFETSIKYGPITFMFEIDSATNLAGGDNYVSGLLGPSWDGVSSITDSDALLWWTGLSWSINPKNSLAAFYGSQEEEVGTTELTGRSSYGLRHTYVVAPNFYIFPHLQFYQKHDTEVGGATIAKGQKATQFGLNFYLLF